MFKLIDRYTTIARIFPVLIAALPLLLATSAWIPFSQWPVKLLGGGAVLAVAAFALAQVARDAGKAIEAPLWAAWGGPPTARMLRHRDGTFDPGMKAKIHAHLVALGAVGLMPTRAQEEADPVTAERAYATCSDWLRTKALELKKQVPFDVVHEENIAYGYRRNLLGIRPYALAAACLAFVVSVAAFGFERRPVLEVGLIASLLTYYALGATRVSVRRGAESYAHRLLSAVEAIPLPSARRQRGSSGRLRKVAQPDSA